MTIRINIPIYVNNGNVWNNGSSVENAPVNIAISLQPEVQFRSSVTLMPTVGDSGTFMPTGKTLISEQYLGDDFMGLVNAMYAWGYGSMFMPFSLEDGGDLPLLTALFGCKEAAAEGAANLTKAELDALYPRVTPRRGLAEEVWDRSKAPNGKVYDPSGVEIKPGEYWELGHTPGNKFSDAQLRAVEQGWDRSTWRQYQNDPDIYRPELRPTNRGHGYESDW